jgi:hypothetical protein
VAFPWYVLIGSVITFIVGFLLGRGRVPSRDLGAGAAALGRAA